MGLSTNSKSVILPGFDETVQNGIDVALNANPVIRNILLNSSSATLLTTSTANVVSAENKLKNDVVTKNPLPTVGVFINRDNRPGFMVYDSDLQPIHGGYLSTATEIGQAFNGQNYTNGGVGSSTVTTSWVTATPFQQQDGAWLVTIPGYNAYGLNVGYGINRDTVRNIYPFFGLVVGERGVRSKISLYLNNAAIGVYPHGGVAPKEQFSLNNAIYSTWSGNGGFGSIGYNDRQKKLVVVAAIDNSNNYRMHVWRNVNRPLNRTNFTTGTLHRFLSEAKTAGTPASTSSTVYYYYNDFQWQQDNSQNYTESRQRMVVTVGDNEYIGMSRFTPSNVTRYATFLPNISSTSGTLQTLNGESHTTSYGIEQGNDYGIRHQITWDNEWAAAYAPYYYYGAGMCTIFSNTVDPRKYYTARQTTTSGGCQLIPFRENKFLFNSSDNNSDGNVGMRMWIVDVGGYAKTGFGISNGSVISNGSSISLQPGNVFTYSFDVRWTSTNYPMLVSPGYWTNG